MFQLQINRDCKSIMIAGLKANKIRDIQTGKRLMLLKMLYIRALTIEQFKEQCIEEGIDYETIEHCCVCAGCSCDFENTGNCKLVEPKSCRICGTKAVSGYILTDEDDEDVDTFWVCDKHDRDPEIEKTLKHGVNPTKLSTIVKKKNR